MSQSALGGCVSQSPLGGCVSQSAIGGRVCLNLQSEGGCVSICTRRAGVSINVHLRTYMFKGYMHAKCQVPAPMHKEEVAERSGGSHDFY